VSQCKILFRRTLHGLKRAEDYIWNIIQDPDNCTLNAESANFVEDEAQAIIIVKHKNNCICKMGKKLRYFSA